MLFNINPTGAGFGTWPHFVAWLDRKPRDEGYNYMNGDICLNCQYHREYGHEYLSPASDMISGNRGSWPKAFPANRPFIEQAEWIARGPRLGYDSWTFGQALDRALEHSNDLVLAVSPQALAVV